MPKAKVYDAMMYYETHGEGEPLLLVPWFSTGYGGWKEQLPVYSKEYKCVIFDWRGVGQSELGKRGHSTRLYADDLAVLLDELGIERAHVHGGGGTGGCVAQELAINYPEKVWCLVLSNTWTKTDKYIKHQIEALVSTRVSSNKDFILGGLVLCFTPEYFNAHYNELTAPGDWFNLSDEMDVYRRLCEVACGHDAEDRLHKIQAPTLIVTGDKDLITGPRFARILHEKILTSELVIMEGAPHGLMWERFDEFNKIKLDFLKKHPMQ